MAYNQGLADQVRVALGAAGADAVEQAMFGGLAFMVHRHMVVGVLGDDVLVRVGAQGYDDALAEPGTRPMDFTGKPMKSMVLVDGATLDDAALDRWVNRALAFTATLPPK